MATATKVELSGGTDGRGIKVVATATAGTTIHTATSDNTGATYDEVWLWAYNGHTANVVLTIELGGATVPDDNIVVTIPYKAGRFLVLDGQILQNSVVVKAFAATANVIVLTGFVNRITN